MGEIRKVTLLFHQHENWGEIQPFRLPFTLRERDIVQRPDGKAHHAYTPEDGVFDFAEDDLGGRQFRLVMRQGARGKILWSSAELLPVDDSRTGEIACPSRYSASKRKTWGDKR